MTVVFSMIAGALAAVLCGITISDALMPYIVSCTFAGMYLLIYAVGLCISDEYSNLTFAVDVLICEAFAIFITYVGVLFGMQTTSATVGIFSLMSFVKILNIKESLMHKHFNKSKNTQN